MLFCSVFQDSESYTGNKMATENYLDIIRIQRNLTILQEILMKPENLTYLEKFFEAGIDLNSMSPEQLYKFLSEGNRLNRFTVTHFRIGPDERRPTIKPDESMLVGGVITVYSPYPKSAKIYRFANGKNGNLEVFYVRQDIVPEVYSQTVQKTVSKPIKKLTEVFQI